MKTIIYARVLFAMTVVLFSCNKPLKKQNRILKGLEMVKNTKMVTDSIGFNFSVTAAPVKFPLPALHSFAYANYNGLLVLIGGKKNGFHGTSNNPPPFKSTTANDSIWVVDIAGMRSWGVPVPAAYYYALTATNTNFCQSGNSLYVCGGFTRTDMQSPVFNTTSNSLLEFNLPNLVQYVKSGGISPALNQVVTMAINSPFVQVTGGELLKVDRAFYLIGGQNYDARYSTGRNGIYTNAVRKFILQRYAGKWVIIDSLALIDTVNMHRRDMNVVPYLFDTNISAVLYGGVFTSKDQAYLNPVNIGGLATGNPTLTVDTMQQMTNEYSCAKANLWFGSTLPFITAMFGGITYKEYDPKLGKMVIGDKGIPMPFSNLVSMIFKYPSISPMEYIQLPPNAPLLPKYLGSNGLFVPLTTFTVTGHPDVLDGRKIIGAMTGNSIMIGYIYGGIISLGPTSGTTPNGYVATYANPILYEVYLNADNSESKTTN